MKLQLGVLVSGQITELTVDTSKHDPQDVALSFFEGARMVSTVQNNQITDWDGFIPGIKNLVCVKR